MELSTDDIELDNWDSECEAVLAGLGPRDAREEEFAEERPTTRVVQRTPIALRAAIVRPPTVTRPTRFPKATRERDAITISTEDGDATKPHALPPIWLELCRD